MADIKPAEISAIIKKQLTGTDISPSLDEVGTVLQVGDGISRVYGLASVHPEPSGTLSKNYMIKTKSKKK